MFFHTRHNSPLSKSNDKCRAAALFVRHIFQDTVCSEAPSENMASQALPLLSPRFCTIQKKSPEGSDATSEEYCLPPTKPVSCKQHSWVVTRCTFLSLQRCQWITLTTRLQNVTVLLCWPCLSKPSAFWLIAAMGLRSHNVIGKARTAAFIHSTEVCLLT